MALRVLLIDSIEFNTCLAGSFSSSKRPSKPLPSQCSSLYASSRDSSDIASSIRLSLLAKQEEDTIKPPSIIINFVFNMSIRFSIKHCSILYCCDHYFERNDTNLASGRYFIAISELSYRNKKLINLVKLGG